MYSLSKKLPKMYFTFHFPSVLNSADFVRGFKESKLRKESKKCRLLSTVWTHKQKRQVAGIETGSGLGLSWRSDSNLHGTACGVRNGRGEVVKLLAGTYNQNPDVRQGSFINMQSGILPIDWNKVNNHRGLPAHGALDWIRLRTIFWDILLFNPFDNNHGSHVVGQDMLCTCKEKQEKRLDWQTDPDVNALNISNLIFHWNAIWATIY